MSRTSAASKRSSQAAASSAAVCTSTYVTPRRRGRPTLAATTVTSAPRRGRLLGQREAHAARRAVADVADGVDRLAGAARGHEHAQARRASRPAAQRGLDGGEQLGRLGQAAGAALAERGERAGAGLAARSRRARAGARGWPGWPGARTSPSFIAGATTSGRRHASAAAVSRLSASPWASLASVFADAGAIRNASARSTSSRCESGRARGGWSPGKAPRSGSRSHSVDAAPARR